MHLGAFIHESFTVASHLTFCLDTCLLWTPRFDHWMSICIVFIYLWSSVSFAYSSHLYQLSSTEPRKFHNMEVQIKGRTKRSYSCFSLPQQEYCPKPEICYQYAVAIIVYCLSNCFSCIGLSFITPFSFVLLDCFDVVTRHFIVDYMDKTLVYI